MILILLQEEQTVTFSPTFIWIDHSWYEKLFVLGLFALLVFVLFRDVQLALGLRKLRKLARRKPVEISPWREVYDRNELRAQFLSKLSILIFFASLFMLSVAMTEAFSAFNFQKGSELQWLAVYFSEELPEFSFGMLICTLLYAGGFFFESRLNRHKLRLDAAAVKADSAQSTD